MRTIAALTPLLVLGLVGCSGHFDAQGFARPHVGYRIDYIDAPRHRFLNEQWRVDNYRLRADDERPGWRVQGTKPDLVLHHRENHGMLWSESTRLSAARERSTLRVLAENWVGSIANNGYFSASAVAPGTIAVTERRYAAEVLDARAVGLNGAPAYAVLVDVANLNQTEITPEARAARALVVFARLPYRRVIVRGHAVTEEPMLLVVGYANAPDDFDEGLADFQAFLASIEFTPDENARLVSR